MMDLPVINTKNKTTVSEAIFSQPVNDELITQLVNSFISNSHQGTKAQKNRSDVRGGGRKPWSKKEQVELEPVPSEVPFGEAGVLHLQLDQKVLIRRKLIKRCINPR